MHVLCVYICIYVCMYMYLVCIIHVCMYLVCIIHVCIYIYMYDVFMYVVNYVTRNRYYIHN
jgi:hypothetical protein